MRKEEEKNNSDKFKKPSPGRWGKKEWDPKKNRQQISGQHGKREEGRKEGRTDGRKEGRKEGRMEGRKDGWKEGRKERKEER